MTFGSFEREPTSLIIVIFGPGGVGKGTLIKRVLDRDDRLYLSRSWTTRARRPGEPLDAYHFVDREVFESNVAAGGFLEWARVLDDLYGTPMPEVAEDRDIVLEIDVQGARQVLAARPDALAVLVLAPSISTQIERLRARGDPEDHVQRRVELGRFEEEEGRQLAKHVIINDDLGQSVDQLLAIIDDARRGDGSRPGAG
ncbi:MAG: guanylate kinase [Actinomycetota bacterium]|nr:guanylate kinase [Actinomycetota bacterium]